MGDTRRFPSEREKGEELEPKSRDAPRVRNVLSEVREGGLDDPQRGQTTFQSRDCAPSGRGACGAPWSWVRIRVSEARTQGLWMAENLLLQVLSGHFSRRSSIGL